MLKTEVHAMKIRDIERATVKEEFLNCCFGENRISEVCTDTDTDNHNHRFIQKILCGIYYYIYILLYKIMTAYKLR